MNYIIAEPLRRTKHQIQMLHNTEYESQCQREMRIILLGKTGQGKSALGNLLCGSQQKKHPFSTGALSSSVTTKAKCVCREYGDRRLCIIDTPGLFDTNCLDNNETMKEIARGFSLASPGPHAFLIVSYGRCTAEEETVLALLQRQFGPQVADYCILIITREDEIRGSDYQSSDTEIIDKYFENAPDILKTLKKNCNDRCVLINNRAEFNQRERKVELLVNMIKQMEQSHMSRYYNHELFAQAEQELRQWEIDEIEQQRQGREQKREQMLAQIRRANLPREEALQREERLNEELQQEQQRLTAEIRDLRRNYVQSSERCEQIVEFLVVISRLLPPPSISRRPRE